MRLIKKTSVLAVAMTMFVAPMAHAEPVAPVGTCEANALDASPAQQEQAVSIAKGHLADAPYVGEADWPQAQVQVISDGKAWVLVPVAAEGNEAVSFHRVAVDLDEGDVATVQTYRISTPDSDTGVSDAVLFGDGELLWEGAVDGDGQVTTSPTSPMDPTQRSRGFCEWGVGALCGTGRSAGCYGACIALGVANGLAGLGCATVCGLISSLGCAAATNRIYGD